mgnify:CR=1 FL=1
MKVIFLDFDGVLNSEMFFVGLDRKNCEKAFPESELSEELISNLNFIIEETGANVVVSSTWRHGRSVAELQRLLETAGFKGKVIDKTPDFLHNTTIPRGIEIEGWLKKNSVESFVIIDDDDDMLENQVDNFLQTSFVFGITHGIALQAIEILNERIH